MAIHQIKYIVLRDEQGFVIDMWENKAQAAKALGVSKQTITNNIPSDTNRTVRHSVKIKGKLSEEVVNINIPTPEELFVNLPDEEWKQIDGFPDYEVSNYGRIRRDFKLKKISAADGKYLHVALVADGNVSYCYVHRLVAAHFLPDWNPELVVNHKDENKQNNHVSNLEMMTVAENFEYSRNLHKEDWYNKAADARKGKWGKKVRCIETDTVYNSITVASEMTGIGRENISNCCNGRQKTAGGFHWKFIEN